MKPVDYWLEMLRHRRWTLHLGGPEPRRPTWIAAHLHWPGCTDVVILRDEHCATAFRTPCADALNPDWVTWVYAAEAVWVLRAVLTLAPPGSPGEPVCFMRAPAACRAPAGRPVTMRPL